MRKEIIIVTLVFFLYFQVACDSTEEVNSTVTSTNTVVQTDSTISTSNLLPHTFQSDGESRFPIMSDDGRFIAFVSRGNLTQNSIDDSESVFVYDRATDQIELVSVALDGNASHGRAFHIALSDSGRFVAFHSHADDLAIGDNEVCEGISCADLFIYDRNLRKMMRIPLGLPTGEGSEDYPRASFSPDERLVYSNVGDKLYDLTTGEIVHTFTTPDYRITDGPSLYFWDTNLDRTDEDTNNRIISYEHSSSGGMLVAFSNVATNWTNNPIIQCKDSRYSATGLRPCANVFMHNLESDETWLVTVGRNSQSSNADIFNPKLSADGRYLAFSSSATNLTDDDFSFCDDSYQCSNIYLYDLKTHETTLITREVNDFFPAGYSRMGDISADGRYIAFSSKAEDIIANDSNNVTDIFVYDQHTGKVILVSKPNSP